MVHPRCKAVRADRPSQEALTPVYPTTSGLGQEAAAADDRTRACRCDLTDPLPAATLGRHAPASFRDSVFCCTTRRRHSRRKSCTTDFTRAWRRIKFDEPPRAAALDADPLSETQAARRAGAQAAATLDGGLLAALPFDMHACAAADACGSAAGSRADLSHAAACCRAMSAAAKTIVAGLRLCRRWINGVQVAIMAPTEILAEQHYRKIRGWLDELGVSLTWLAGGLRKRRRHRHSLRSRAVPRRSSWHARASFRRSVRFAQPGPRANRGRHSRVRIASAACAASERHRRDGPRSRTSS
jgi:ATP-dependent DNA helicase RecG